jgi:hypothetical protein
MADGVTNHALGNVFRCEHLACVAARRRRARGETSIFMPSRNVKQQDRPLPNPTRKCFLSSALGESPGTATKARAFGARGAAVRAGIVQ